jgi:hypothetical protein
MALEAGAPRRRSALVAGMCTAMAVLYGIALLFPATRSFFELTLPDPGMLATALIASAVSIAALTLAGFSVRVEPAQSKD